MFKALKHICVELYFVFDVGFCACVQRAAPTRRVSAMKAASVGATQLSTDKLKVRFKVISKSL